MKKISIEDVLKEMNAVYPQHSDAKSSSIIFKSDGSAMVQFHYEGFKDPIEKPLPAMIGFLHFGYGGQYA